MLMHDVCESAEVLICLSCSIRLQERIKSALLVDFELDDCPIFSFDGLLVNGGQEISNDYSVISIGRSV